MNTLEARRRLLGRNVYKRTTEGNPAIAQGSLARRYPGITMQGWTEQPQYEGNQLFDKSGIVLTSEVQYIPVNVGDGEFTLSTQYNNTYRRDVFFLPGNVSDGASSSENGVALNNPKTVTSENGYVTVGLQTNTEGDMNPLDYDIMLNSGSTALPYEPYTGGQPSPNPDYPQPITSAGKYNEETRKYEYEVEISSNLIPGTYKQATQNNVVFTMDNGKVTVVGNGTANRFTLKTNSFELKPGHYTLNIVKGVPFTVFMSNEGTAGAIGNIASGRTTLEFDLTETTTVSLGVTTRAGSEKNEEFYPMLVRGSEPLPYEPYRTPQTVTLTSDRPLTKWDKLKKRNGQWGWVYKSNEIVLDGSEDEDWKMQMDENHNVQFFISISDGLLTYAEPFKETFYCETFIATNSSGTIPDWQVRRGNYNGLAPVFKPSDDINKVDLFMNFLIEHPATILYETTEETFVPLSPEEQEAMNALYTFRPITVLSNDAGCEMSLTYKTKKSLEVTT